MYFGIVSYAYFCYNKGVTGWRFFGELRVRAVNSHPPSCYRDSIKQVVLFFRGWGTPTPKKQNNLLNRISITRRWVTVYCPNPKFTKEPSARYPLIITKISIADYTKVHGIGLRLYCTKQRKGIFKKISPKHSKPVSCAERKRFAKKRGLLIQERIGDNKQKISPNLAKRTDF